jgi:hypothetical protein
MLAKEVAVACLAVSISIRLRKTHKKDKRLWIREWITCRNETGAYECLMKELAVSDPGGFQTFVRLSFEDFHFLAERVDPLLYKRDTTMRKAVSVEERLAVALHYLATGKLNEKFASLNF